MAKKSRPSFDAPKTPGSSAGWVYKSDETAPVASPEPAVAVREPRAVSHEPRLASHPLDRAVLPFTLLMMTALAPVTWLRGKR